MSTSGPLWRCSRPGCEYVAQLLPSSNLEMLIRYHEATHDADVVIWDDPPSDPDRPFDNKVMLDWYRRQRGTEHSETAGEYIARNQARMDEVQVEIDAAIARCATWLYPAAVTAAAVGLVWLSYRRARR